MKPATFPTLAPRLGTRRRAEAGTASIWALLVIAGAFTVLFGLVVDGGRLIDARLDSARAAAQAARTATDALSASAVRSGHDTVATAAAEQRAQAYLHAAGKRGTVAVHGASVTVTVTGRSDTEILAIIGISSFPIRETQTARAITEQTP